MNAAEIIAALEAIDPKNGTDSYKMREIDADIALLVSKPWRGATVEKANLCDADASARNMDAIGAGWVGWCIFTRDGDAVHFRRVPRYTSSIEAALSLWKWPRPDLVPSHPVPCCIAALKARQVNGD
jgi:hypothetical protein